MGESRIRHFWQDLKRRRIFSSGAVYVVVAWAIVQACGLVFPAFGAPAWMMRAVLVAAFAGFPVALVLTWVFDVTAHGVDITDDIPAGAEGKPSRRWLRPLLAAPLLALIVGGTAWLWTSRLAKTGDTEFTQQVRPDELPIIAVLPLENLTGRKELSWTGAGIATLVRDDLAQSHYLAVVSAGRTQRLVSEHKDLQGLLASAVEAGITHVLTGEVLRTPKGLTVTSRLTDLRRNVELGANRREGLEPDEALSISTSIASLVKQGLGLPGTEKIDVFSADFASHNIAAYEAFIAGMENFLNFDYPDARRAFEVAVQKSPEFAMARYRLAHTLAAMGDSEGASVQIAAARQAASHLSTRERGYIDAGAHYFKREFAEAERGYRALLAEHPYDSEARLLLIYALDGQDRYEDALAESEILVAQDPGDEIGWSAVADYNLKLHRYTAASEALEKLLKITPGNPNAHYLLGDSHYFQKQFDQAEKEYSRALQLDPGFGDATLQLAHIDVLGGKPGQAVVRLRSMLAAKGLSASLRTTAGFELASLLRARGDCDGADQALDQVHDEIATEGIRVALELSARARCQLDRGNVAEARRLAADAVVHSPGNTTRYLFVRGLAEWADHDLAAVDQTILAIRALAPRAAPAGGPEPKAAAYLLGLTRLQKADANGAVAAMRTAVEGSGYEIDLYAVGLARALSAAGSEREARETARAASRLPEPVEFKMALEPSRYEALKLSGQPSR